ncbi:MAG: PKD domain-containing protein, partial [Actinomycetes bacterium]
MWRPDETATAGKWLIHKLNTSSQAWEPQVLATGAADPNAEVDTRDKSHYDVLSDGNKLYVVASNEGATDEIRILRYTYSAGRYTSRAQASTTALGVQYATIAKQADGQLVIAYTASNGVRYMTSNAPHDGASWSSPQSINSGGHPPVAGPPGATTINDDVAVVTPVGNTIGVMWSVDDTSSSGGFYFSVRGTSGSFPATPETAWSGAYVGDNHISARTAPDGRVIAVVKSSLNDKPVTSSHTAAEKDADPLIAMLERSPTGAWAFPNSSSKPGTPGRFLNVSTVGQNATRPMLVLDHGAQQAHVIITEKQSPPEIGGKLRRRVAPLGSLAFGTPSLGELFVDDSNGSNSAIRDATSTKQAIDTTTGGSGLVVLASDKTSKNYLHGCVGGPCTTEPKASFTATPASGVAPHTVNFTNASTGSPSSRTIDFGDGTSASLPATGSVPHVYSVPGTYTAKLVAQYPAGMRESTQSITVTGATTTTALTVAPSPSTSGALVTLTATVTASNAAPPAGTVTFR